MALYLVTGGGGFIGSNTVEELIDLEEQVRVLDNFSTGHRKNLAGVKDSPSMEIVEGDIRSLSVCEKAVEGVDYIIHLAALGSIPRSVEDPVTTNQVNAGGTLNMLQAARNRGIRRFVYAGSSSSYGDNIEIPQKETVSGRPLSPYAVSKLTGEMYSRCFNDLFGLEVVCLRYFNVFGPKQDPDSPYAAVVPSFFKALLNGQEPVIYGDGEQTRDFTYVKNVVSANLLACTSGPESLGEMFNIASGERISVNRLFDEIRSLTGSEKEPEYREARKGDIRHTLASIDKAREYLNYNVIYDVFRGLKESSEWYMENMRE